MASQRVGIVITENGDVFDFPSFKISNIDLYAASDKLLEYAMYVPRCILLPITPSKVFFWYRRFIGCVVDFKPTVPIQFMVNLVASKRRSKHTLVGGSATLRTAKILPFPRLTWKLVYTRDVIDYNVVLSVYEYDAELKQYTRPLMPNVYEDGHICMGASAYNIFNFETQFAKTIFDRTWVAGIPDYHVDNIFVWDLNGKYIGRRPELKLHYRRQAIKCVDSNLVNVLLAIDNLKPRKEDDGCCTDRTGRDRRQSGGVVAS